MNIEALYEEGTPAIKGFWIEGHQSIRDFINCAEIEFDIEDKPIDPRNVFHGWAFLETDEEIIGDFDYFMRFSKRPRDNAKMATYFFYK